ncbi:MAG: galactokinase, partial [Pseudomonadota bacterium]|nr:galactokinase [Pseudomonadota bacterium]
QEWQRIMLEHIRSQFAATFGDDNHLQVIMAPGRVNLIGEYTDFNEGFVFPMTVDRGVYVGIRARDDQRVRVKSIRFGELIDYRLDDFEKPELGHWSCYVLGVIEELRLLGLVSHGFDAVIDGNLNLGAGLSSSAALETATTLALQSLFDFEMSRVDVATLCQRVEHRYANVMCGIMDQFASGLGRSNHALLLDCRTLSHVNISTNLDKYRIAIISSEVKRELASSAYNDRRLQCEEGVALFRQFDPTIASLRDVTPDLFDAYGDQLSEIVFQRCRHVITENARVLDASAALAAGDLTEFGRLMTASHNSLRADFEVSCDELDCLVDIANGTEGVLGSRMTGAGFGGCTVTLIHMDAIETLRANLLPYTDRFGLNPEMFVLQGNLEAGPVSGS